jgi:hypothetical protein
MFMNDYDLDEARHRFTQRSQPNRLALVMVVDHLREWTDSHSDGWAYWSKPMYAAGSAMRLIDSSTWFDDEDLTDEQVRDAVRPIKAFLTRQAKVKHGRFPNRMNVTPEERELILRSVTA